MAFGKRFKTIYKAKKYLADNPHRSWEIYKFPSDPRRVYKYFVGSYSEWLNL